MGDGKTLADHWPLLLILAGAIGGGFVFVRAVLNAIDNRTDERVKLAMSNGLGDLLSQKMKAAVLEALSEHQVQCPHAQRVTSLEDRVVTLERG